MRAGLGLVFFCVGACAKKSACLVLPYGTPSTSRVVPTFLHSCPFPAGHESKETALFSSG